MRRLNHDHFGSQERSPGPSRLTRSSDVEGESFLVKLSDLSVHLPAGPRREVHAVRNVSLHVGRGERVGIVGESGSGKSVTGRAISGLLPASPRVRVSGEFSFDGESMFNAPKSAWHRMRSHNIGMIFQDPLTYLNPVMKVGRQVAEALPGRQRKSVMDVARFLSLAGLDEAEVVAKKFPHELSGGMRQRVLIAIALAKQPDLIIADEPTTALDATVQHRVLSTLDESVATLGTSLILISHDLAVVASMTDRIYVMYGGRVVEDGPTESILSAPRHPYTQALLRSVRSLIEPEADLWSITPELRQQFDADPSEGIGQEHDSAQVPNASEGR